MAERHDNTDPLARLTDAQRRAVRIVGRSALVSAAAGSGKTTVLAERCAALVCDIESEEHRCNINELLVVTFTDAAAGEMRSRISEAIRRRIRAGSAGRALREQLYLLDSASISTIHAFCRTLIQRWFPQAGVDPQASVLDGDEAELLRREVLDGLFVELYGGSDALSRSFQQLVDDYGAGQDDTIARIVLRLHAFVGSLPDDEAWLRRACQRMELDHPEGLSHNLDAHQRDRLRTELDAQAAYHVQMAGTVRQCWPIAAMHADALDDHAARLQAWREQLRGGSPEQWEDVADEIHQFEFPHAASRPRGLSDDDKARFDAAKEVRDEAKKHFAKRLQEAICAFTAQEYRDGLARVAPYVRTLAELTATFEERYQKAKAVQAAVDFNDLQRRAFAVLAAEGDPARPSAVARELQQRYRYVLVDEFQDIDPLQDAILRLVSRESADPPQGNLFAVGDIKQSIYRFRLAEPLIFADRGDTFAQGSAMGELITLQDNFRSRSSVIDAINRVFEPLMQKDFGGSAYDESARLHAALAMSEQPNPADPADVKGACVFDRPALELHVLEPVTRQTRTADEDDDGPTDADELEGIEREAYLIARRIQQWKGDNTEKLKWHVTVRETDADGKPCTRAIEYRDIVILLRSMPHKAGPIADVLRRMGIPVRVERDDTGLDSTEFRDVISVLQLLDNQDQDIPLAAVLRSPLLDRPFSEDDLLTMRLADRKVMFHEAVSRYAREGSDEMLRDRLGLVFDTLSRWRERIQRSPVADVLWEIYEETGYLAYVAGLPDGARRREHLVRLHEMARSFGRFHRQGLHRFLRFVEQMLDQDRAPAAPSSAGGDENVVRIMTVHTSKGLEFPVVILADAAKRFNLEDHRAAVLLDRDLGIAMRAVDPERRIMYPTLPHQLAAERGLRESLSEELRVLYVALTRAREHLLVVGRSKLTRVEMVAAESSAGQNSTSALSRLRLETAASPMDWLLTALGQAAGETVTWATGAKQDAGARSSLIKVYAHERSKTDTWRLPPAVETERADALANIANLQPLPREEPLDSSDEPGRILNSLDVVYPALALTAVPARLAATDLERRGERESDVEKRAATPTRPTDVVRPTFLRAAERDVARHRGVATHRFLQLVDPTRPCDAKDLETQHREMVDAGRMQDEDASTVMLDGVAWFFATPLGKRVQQYAAQLRRELAFVARSGPEAYDPDLNAQDDRDSLLVRGVVDAILETADGLEMIDYKTDAVTPDACPARADAYRPQMNAYAAAMSDAFRRPVTCQWLVFLHARHIVDLAAD